MDLQLNENIKAITFIKELDTSYKEAINHFTKYLEVNNLPIEPESIQAYYQALNDAFLDKTYSANTVKIRRAGCKYAIQELLDNSSDMFNMEAQFKMQQIFRILNKKITPPKVMDSIVESEMIISKEEYKKLRSECESDMVKSFMSFLWNTGCRVSEMTGIKLTDFKEDGNTLKVTVIGKGKKARTFPVPRYIYEEAKRVFNGSIYLFEHSGKPYSIRYVAERFKTISNRILGRTCNPHMYRHSFITNMVNSGMVVKKISKLVGHNSSNITDRYTHVTATIEEIEEALS